MRYRPLRPLHACLLLAGLWARPAGAEVPRFLSAEGFAHLSEGSAESTSLSEEGAIGLRPKVRQRFADPAVAAGAAGLWRDEVVWARLDGEPQLVAINAGGKLRTLLPLAERMVTRIVGDGERLWVAGVSKAGASLQRLHKKEVGEPQPLTEARFVWDMLPTGDGGLLLATGEPGGILLQRADGARHWLFRADEAHIKALYNDAKLGLFAGGGERGVVYHGDSLAAYLRGRGQPFRALLDTRHTEVTALCGNGNHLFVAAITGQLAPAVSEGEGHGHASKPPAEIRSSLLRVDVHGTAEMLAGSGDEAIFDVAQDGDGQILVATGSANKHDPRGRLYRIDPTRKVVSLLYQAPSRRLTQLLPRAKEGPILVAQDGARLLELAGEVDEQGTYLTAPLDAGITSRFGAVQALGDFPGGSKGTLSVRSGQTKEPDASWSNWSAPIAAPGNKPVKVPNGRYAQVRLVLTGRQKAQPQVWRLRLTYLRQNLPPFVREVTALPKGHVLLPLPQAVSNDEARSKITTVAEAQSEEPTKTVARVRQVPERGAMTVKWIVDEPNGDELSYTLWQRRAGGGDWQLVKDDLQEPFYTFHSAQLADGYYNFRVRASDFRSNPAHLALTDSRDSRAILVDNTPPTFARLSASAQAGGSVRIKGEVGDAVSPLLALTYALDGGELRPLATADGLLDGLHETFDVVLTNLAAGEHAVTLRARDEADNEGYAQLRFDVPAKR